MHNNVGTMQLALGAQGQQIGRGCRNEIHMRGRGGLARNLAQKRAKLALCGRCAARRQRGIARTTVKPCPEVAPRPARRQHLRRGPKPLPEPRQTAQSFRQALFQIGLDLPRQNRCRAFGADRHDHRVTVDNRGGYERACLQIIDHVQQHARAVRQGGKCRIGFIVVIGGITQRGLRKISQKRRAVMQGDLPSFGQCNDTLYRIMAENHDLRFGLEQQAQLGQRAFASTADNHTAGAQI